MLKIFITNFLILLVFFPDLSYAALDNTSRMTDEATNNILTLNNGMFLTLHQQEALYQRILLENHPVIVALFNSQGGQFILYRPGHEPLVVPSFPQANDYALAAAVQHTVMNAYELSMQGLTNKDASSSWQDKMLSLQTEIALATKSLPKLDISSSEKHLFQVILNETNGFITDNLWQGNLSRMRADNFAIMIKPYLKQLSQIITTNQVNYWMNVVGDWKKLLGHEWQKTYAVSLYIPVRPQTDIFYDIFLYYMGKNAGGKRAYHFTSLSYSPTAEQALTLLAKSMPDSDLANQTFGQFYFPYANILGEAGRQAIAKNSALKR